jgi:hypothetical protein
MIGGIKCVDNDISIIYFFIERTITDRIWSIIAATHKEQHRCDAEQENKPEHLQFTISFIYFDSDNKMRKRKSQSEIIWTVEVSSFCSNHTGAKKEKIQRHSGSRVMF